MTKNNETISCPKCGHEFELSKALTERLEVSMRADIEAGAREKERQLEGQLKALKSEREGLEEQISQRVEAEKKRLSEEATRKAREDFQVELGAANEELEARRTELKAAKLRELELLNPAPSLENPAS